MVLIIVELDLAIIEGLATGLHEMFLGIPGQRLRGRNLQAHSHIASPGIGVIQSSPPGPAGTWPWRCTVSRSFPSHTRSPEEPQDTAIELPDERFHLYEHGIEHKRYAFFGRCQKNIALLLDRLCF